MAEPIAIATGLIVGVIGSLAPAFLFEQALKGKQSPSVATGLAGIFVSYVMLVAAVFVVWLAAPSVVLSFGCAEVASFLLVWVVQAGRAWRAAQRSDSPRERKSGESTRGTRH